MYRVLNKIYNNSKSPAYLAGINAVHREAKKQLPGITVANVRQFLSTQDAYTLHKPIQRRFPRNRIIASGLDTDWQVDLMDMRQLKQHNDGYSVALIVVDVLSKFLWSRALKDKRPVTVAKAFADILRKSHRLPWRVCSDRGEEFKSRFREFVRSKGINHFFVTSPDVKCAVVERHIKTIKNKVFRYFTKERTLKWVGILPNIIDGINHTVSSVTKMRPVDVHSGNARTVWATVYGVPKPKPVKFKFKVGDHVRMTKEKGKLTKGYKANFTTEVFVVRECLARLPPVYRLDDLHGEDISGVFYNQELVEVYKRPLQAKTRVKNAGRRK
jgi:hypothetical protein